MRLNQKMDFLFVLMGEILTPGIIVIKFNISINFNGKHYLPSEGLLSFYHSPLMQWKQGESWICQSWLDCFKLVSL